MSEEASHPEGKDRKPLAPNEETIAAMREARIGTTLEPVTLEELMAVLTDVDASSQRSK